MISEKLKHLGFFDNEITVYLALFEFGKTRAGTMIERTGLHRNLIYTALDELTRRQLVTKTIVGGVAEFVANDPSRLLDEVEERKRIAMQAAAELKKKQEETPREVVVYEGWDGVKRSRDQALQKKKGEILYVLGGARLETAPALQSYWRQFHRKRAARGIQQKNLYDADTKSPTSIEYSEAKSLPFHFDSPVWFAGIDDQFEIGIPGDNPLTFTIRSRDAVAAFQSFFEFLWRQEAKVFIGHDALRDAFYNMVEELRPGESYYVLGAPLGILNKFTQEFFADYHTYRIKKGVVAHLLAYGDSVGVLKKSMARCGDPAYRVSRIRSFISAPAPMQMNMYNGKTVMIIYKKEPVVIHFSAKEIHDSFKAYFDVMWRGGNA